MCGNHHSSSFNQLSVVTRQSAASMLSELLLLCAAASATAGTDQFRVVYEWYKLDFTWPDDQAKLDAYSKKLYEAKNNIIQNVRIWDEVAFLTLPRSKSGVPATLVTVPAIPSKSPSASPRLEPFPSWAYQEVGNCACLQNVQAIEVDPDGFLWVADSGSVGEFREFTDTDTKCPPKLVVFNIAKRELVSEYEFSKEFLQPASIFTDIVLDPRGNKTVYISAVGETEAVIVVYNNHTKSAIKIEGLPSVKPTSVIVNGTEAILKLNKLSLALSLWRQKLYLNPSWEETLYTLDIHSSQVNPVGKLPGLSYALTLDSKNALYYTVLEKDAVGRWNTSEKFEDSRKNIAENSAFLQFPSSFSFDASHNLWVLSNRFQTFLAGDTNTWVPNFRLVRAFTGSESYMFAPKPSGSTVLKVSSAWLVLTLFLVFMR